MECSPCAMIGLNHQDSWIIVLALCQLLGSSAIPPTILGDSTQVNWKQTACKATPEKSQRAGVSEVDCDGSSCLLGGVFSVGCAHTGSHVQGSHNLICSWRRTFTGWDTVCVYVCIWFQVYIAQELSTFFFFFFWAIAFHWAGWLMSPEDPPSFFPPGPGIESAWDYVQLFLLDSEDQPWVLVHAEKHVINCTIITVLYYAFKRMTCIVTHKDAETVAMQGWLHVIET